MSGGGEGLVGGSEPTVEVVDDDWECSGAGAEGTSYVLRFGMEWESSECEVVTAESERAEVERCGLEE